MLNREGASRRELSNVVSLALGTDVTGLDDSSAAELLELAKQHGIAGAVAETLADRNSHVTPAIRDQAKQWRAATLARHMRAVSEVGVIGGCLGNAGIPFAVIKGPVLAALHHPQPSTRSYVDVDILVEPSAFPQALDELDRAGCELLTRNWRSYAAEVPAEVVLRSPTGLPVDLHWHVVNEQALRLRRRISTEELMSRARWVNLGDCTTATLDPSDTLLHLCVHGADAGGDRLLWLFDIHSAVTAEPPDWTQVTTRAHEWHVTGSVGVMLSRAARTFGTFLPDGIFRELGQSAWVSLDAGVSRLQPAGSTYPSRSLTRSMARATDDRPAVATRNVLKRGATWLMGGGPLRPQGTGWIAPEDPRSGLYGGGGSRESYLAAVEAECALS